MIEVPATEFAKNFGRYRETAQREPVAVTSHQRVTGVFVSAEEYQEYLRLKRLATHALFVEELSAESLAAVSQAQMDSRHEELNVLMDAE